MDGVEIGIDQRNCLKIKSANKKWLITNDLVESLTPSLPVGSWQKAVGKKKLAILPTAHCQLPTWDLGGAAIFDFIKELGKAFIPIYTYLMKKNKDIAYGEQEKRWQALRRSRYVEFNLIYDLGTKFGLDTGGRTESILMSMPPQASWDYNFKPDKGSKEEMTLKLLKKGVDWINMYE